MSEDDDRTRDPDEPHVPIDLKRLVSQEFRKQFQRDFGYEEHPRCPPGLEKSFQWRGKLGQRQWTVGPTSKIKEDVHPDIGPTRTEFPDAIAKIDTYHGERGAYETLASPELIRSPVQRIVVPKLFSGEMQVALENEQGTFHVVGVKYLLDHFTLGQYTLAMAESRPEVTFELIPHLAYQLISNIELFSRETGLALPDLKPGNVLVNRYGPPALKHVDFGEITELNGPCLGFFTPGFQPFNVALAGSGVDADEEFFVSSVYATFANIYLKTLKHFAHGTLVSQQKDRLASFIKTQDTHIIEQDSAIFSSYCRKYFSDIERCPDPEGKKELRKTLVSVLQGNFDGKVKETIRSFVEHVVTGNRKREAYEVYLTNLFDSVSDRYGYMYAQVGESTIPSLEDGLQHMEELGAKAKELREKFGPVTYPTQK